MQNNIPVNVDQYIKTLALAYQGGKGGGEQKTILGLYYKTETPFGYLS